MPTSSTSLLLELRLLEIHRRYASMGAASLRVNALPRQHARRRLVMADAAGQRPILPKSGCCLWTRSGWSDGPDHHAVLLSLRPLVGEAGLLVHPAGAV